MRKKKLKKSGILHVNYLTEEFVYEFNAELTKLERYTLEIKIFYEFVSKYYYINRNKKEEIYRIENFKISDKKDRNSSEIRKLKDYITGSIEELQYIKTPEASLIRSIGNYYEGIKYNFVNHMHKDTIRSLLSINDKWACIAIITNLLKDKGYEVEVFDVIEDIFDGLWGTFISISLVISVKSVKK